MNMLPNTAAVPVDGEAAAPVPVPAPVQAVAVPAAARRILITMSNEVILCEKITYGIGRRM